MPYTAGGKIKGHDDVIKWKHIPRHWSFVRGIHRSPVNSPHKGQCRGALLFSLICVSTNGWVNNREAGDLRLHHTHYDVTVIGMLGGRPPFYQLPSVVKLGSEPLRMEWMTQLPIQSCRLSGVWSLDLAIGSPARYCWVLLAPHSLWQTYLDLLPLVVSLRDSINSDLKCQVSHEK